MTTPNSKLFRFIFCVFIILQACNNNSNFDAKAESSGNAIEVGIDVPAVADELVNAAPPAMLSEFEPSKNEDSFKEITDKKSLDKQKIIKDGTITIKTKDIDASKKKFDDFLKKINAYYEREDLENDEQVISFYLKVRVPSNKFEVLIRTIETGDDEIVRKNIEARDVTEEYVDIESRLSNKREYLNRYRAILAKASTVKDILEVEENIRVIQEEIESKEGRLNFLKDQVAFSTLNINLIKDKEFVYKAKPQDKFSERLKDALGKGWKSVVNFVLSVISGWPIFIVIIVVIFILKRLLKRRKMKKS